MRYRDTARSRLVGLLKVGLPLAALALLSTVFLLARTLDPQNALPWAQVDIEELLADPRLTAPRFAGITEQGDELLFSAQKAWPGGAADTGAHAADARLQLISPTGAETRVTAGAARVDSGAQRLVLEGDVQMHGIDGWQLRSQQITVSLDRSSLISPGPVQGQGPQITLQAGAMTISRPAPDAPEVVVFNEGVKLLYQPQPPAPPSAP